MAQLLVEIKSSLDIYKDNLPFLLSLLGGVWAIQIVNWMMRYRLNYLGIVPRHLLGLPGIVFSPFLHGNFNHLAFNTIPLFALAGMVLLLGKQPFFMVSAFIILTSGAATWLFGRRAIHIGASSLIMGYWSYLLVLVIRRPSWLTIVLALVTIYYFGGMLINLFPTDRKTSWEGHLFGALAGVAAAFLGVAGWSSLTAWIG